ncbi:hypothetical protein BDZ89DRAFT_1032884 [Hymenopellis radicata]|nr:hypothetical protein BDZ89DRAFT_1032884 [Hymenopellis radicata]
MFSLSLPRLALVVLCILLACLPSWATSAKIFQWAFQSNSVSSTLGTCQEFGIVVSKWPDYTGNSSGVPPYYMRAWEQGGSVQTTLLGSDASSLKWTVTNAVGSKLLLNVIDSNDSSAGVAPKLFTIDTGSTTNCVVNDPVTTFTVKSNLTEGTLAACQPWGLRIKNGVPPYNISFAQLDSPVVTNVTTNQDDDAYTYINRADGASVVDSTGRVANGNPSIMTASQTDIDCGSLNSSSGNSTELDAAAAQEAQEQADRDSKKRTGIIVGVVIGVLALLLIGGGAFWWWYRRRNNGRKSSLDFDPDLAPTPYMSAGPSGQVLSINAFLDQPQQPYSPKSSSNGMTPMTMSDATRSSTHFDPYHMVETRTGPPSTSGRPTSSGSSNSNAGNMANFPLAPLRRSKAMEAGLGTGMSDSTFDSVASDASSRPLMERSQSAHPPAGASTEAPWPARSTSMIQTAGEREIIYQHRDGGVVRELPPPYLDRSRVDGGAS